MGISDVNNTLIDHLNNISKAAEKATTRLSSGKRINSASDDAAGLAVYTSLEADSKIYNRARLNADDGISITNIADSTLSTVSDITTRQRELAMQSANGVYSNDQRAAMNDEYQQLEQEKQRQLQTAEFNGSKIFSGGDTTLQVGATGDGLSQIGVPSVSVESLSAGVADISTAENARAAVDDLDDKHSSISALQGQIGAAQSRVEQASISASNSSVETATAASRIRDADIAQEAANFTSTQIQQQVNVAMNAHANNNASVVLALLK